MNLKCLIFHAVCANIFIYFGWWKIELIDWGNCPLIMQVITETLHGTNYRERYVSTNVFKSNCNLNTIYNSWVDAVEWFSKLYQLLFDLFGRKLYIFFSNRMILLCLFFGSANLPQYTETTWIPMDVFASPFYLFTLEAGIWIKYQRLNKVGLPVWLILLGSYRDYFRVFDWKYQTLLDKKQKWLHSAKLTSSNRSN